GVVNILPGYRITLQQGLIARGGGLRQIIVGLRRRQFRPRLLELLIQLGRIDFRQELTLFNPAADVHVPALQIAARPRVNRRVNESLDVSRQYYFFLRSATLGLSERYRGHGEILRVGFDVGGGADTSGDAPVNHGARGDQKNHQPEDDFAYPRGSRGLARLAGT